LPGLHLFHEANEIGISFGGELLKCGSIFLQPAGVTPCLEVATDDLVNPDTGGAGEHYGSESRVYQGAAAKSIILTGGRRNPLSIPAEMEPTMVTTFISLSPCPLLPPLMIRFHASSICSASSFR
jgi:hypothetical protein